jgi:hypothetical protein
LETEKKHLGKVVFLCVLIVYIVALSAHFDYGEWVGPIPPFRADDYIGFTRTLVDNHTLQRDAELPEEIHAGTSLEAFSLSRGADGHMYTKASPGLSLLAVPLYFIFGDAGAYYTNAIVSALTVLFIFLLCRLYTDEKTSLVTALVFAFGSIIFTYSQMFYAEALSGFLTISSFYYMSLAIKEGNAKNGFASGLLLGFMPLAKAPLAVFIPFFTLYILYYGKKRILIPFFCGLAVFLFVFFLYNFLLFGNPLRTGYQAAVHLTEGGVVTGDATRDFRNNPLVWGQWITIWLVLTQPILIISLMGLFRWFKMRENRFVILLLLMTMAFFGSWASPLGGWCWSSRYQFPLVPLLALPFALAYKDFNRILLWTLIGISLVMTLATIDYALFDLFSYVIPRSNANYFRHYGYLIKDPWTMELLGQ